MDRARGNALARERLLDRTLRNCLAGERQRRGSGQALLLDRAWHNGLAGHARLSLQQLLHDDGWWWL